MLYEQCFDYNYQEDQDVDHDLYQQYKLNDGPGLLGTLTLELRSEVALHVLKKDQQNDHSEYQCCEKNKHILNLSMFFA